MASLSEVCRVTCQHKGNLHPGERLDGSDRSQADRPVETFSIFFVRSPNFTDSEALCRLSRALRIMLIAPTQIKRTVLELWLNGQSYLIGQIRSGAESHLPMFDILN